MTTTKRVDLNADAGESFGPWPMGDDARLFPHLTSVNLACGVHAGDPLTIARAVRLAQEHEVQIGGHPGFPDLVGFGRRDLAMDPEELYASVLYQLGALHAFVAVVGLNLHHVKPHGALYLRMVSDATTADAVARAIRDFDNRLPLVLLGGPAGRTMLDAANEHGLAVVREAFPDRAYLADGHLAPRSIAGAVIRDPAVVAKRAAAMISTGSVAALDSGTAKIEADTLCLHGDNPEAPEIAAAVRAALAEAGVEVEAY